MIMYCKYVKKKRTCLFSGDTNWTFLQRKLYDVQDFKITSMRGELKEYGQKELDGVLIIFEAT